MPWKITTESNTKQDHHAVYYLVLPESCEVLHTDDLSYSPHCHVGDFTSFRHTHTVETPLIPVDPHHAICMDWVDARLMAKNMMYLSEEIRAAVALVT